MSPISPLNHEPKAKPKPIFFDFMGTCLDWHSSVLPSLPSQLSERVRSTFAVQWRHHYFDYNAARLASNQPPEDFDTSLRNTLDQILQKSEHSEHATLFTTDVKKGCIDAWHSMKAWPDVAPAIDALKRAGHEVFVFANGTTRLQLDLCRSSGLKFDMLFSSELLGVYKPAPESYTRILELVGVREPGDAVMVACHAYDNRGARGVGMKTVYVTRWTDDVNEDTEIVKGENDVFLRGGMEGLVEVVQDL